MCTGQYICVQYRCIALHTHVTRCCTVFMGLDSLLIACNHRKYFRYSTNAPSISTKRSACIQVLFMSYFYLFLFARRVRVREMSLNGILRVLRPASCFNARDGNQSIYWLYLHVHSNRFVHKSYCRFLHTPQFTPMFVWMHNIDMFGIELLARSKQLPIIRTHTFTMQRRLPFLPPPSIPMATVLAPLIYQCFGAQNTPFTPSPSPLFIYKFTFLLRSAHNTTSSIINMKRNGKNNTSNNNKVLLRLRREQEKV